MGAAMLKVLIFLDVWASHISITGSVSHREGGTKGHNFCQNFRFHTSPVYWSSSDWLNTAAQLAAPGQQLTAVHFVTSTDRAATAVSKLIIITIHCIISGIIPKRHWQFFHTWSIGALNLTHLVAFQPCCLPLYYHKIGLNFWLNLIFITYKCPQLARNFSYNFL